VREIEMAGRQKTEVRRQKTEVGRQKSEVGREILEKDEQNSNDRLISN